ncbi:MAG: hypothetical protein WD768_15625 [Phycisphaeraceae bacterium]
MTFSEEITLPLKFCLKKMSSRSKFSQEGLHRCYRTSGHGGKCSEYPYLEHLRKVAPKVAKKIERDSIMTTGASWKSKDAGPNRVRRWAMLMTDKKLLRIGIDMKKLKPIVVSKLREKAAKYEDCMAVAQRLTALTYGMPNAPRAPKEISEYLEALFGPIDDSSTTCLVCRNPLDFEMFASARRGKAEIETSHSNPRLHTPENVGFAHRACNIAQGNKTLDEFYGWISGILERVGYTIQRPS